MNPTLIFIIALISMGVLLLMMGIALRHKWYPIWRVDYFRTEVPSGYVEFMPILSVIVPDHNWVQPEQVILLTND